MKQARIIDDPIRTALAAYGLSGKVFHAPLISAHPGFVLKKILERGGKQRSRERHPGPEIVSDFGKLLEDETIELIVINTPEHTHFELGKQALEAGKHVIVEKAFTVSTAEAQTLIDLASEKGKILSVFQNSRWHGDFITIQKIVEKRLLGELAEFEAHFDRYRNTIQEDSWKEEAVPGTGSLYNLGSHIIDQSLVLFGMPHAVWADIRIQRPGGKVCDCFELVLYYGQLKVTLKSSYLVREPGPRYTLHGTAGSFIKYGGDPQEALLKAGKSPLDEDFGHEPESQWGTLNTQWEGLHFSGKIETCRGSYMGFYDNIYGAIREKASLAVTPVQAQQTIAVIEAALKSSEEKRIISLSESQTQHT
ncbi:Gfo/Idh/MocA family oxidoreductase [Compostibacter hankyongensis]|uniref:Gfo/Idh/MocA family oxidoreductase n=1 Tax=Compostibacter hankyongensis TaxID=1007089 RepID=A0ABP8G9L8_9BACT